MRFHHAPEIWREYPELAVVTLHVRGVRPAVDVSAAVQARTATARARLGESAEGEWHEIQAWRRAFSRMGLKPTQYRCAAESLLRRLRKDSSLPAVPPLVDLCNAFSAAFGVPIAVFDLARVEGDLEVRHATGNERYLDFSGEEESPPPGEVVFADDAGHAHARRWCHRQSARSALGDDTDDVLIVAEAMHAGAPADQARLSDELSAAIAAAWGVAPVSRALSAADPVCVV